jgi:hypothetical protein
MLRAVVWVRVTLTLSMLVVAVAAVVVFGAVVMEAVAMLVMVF